MSAPVPNPYAQQGGKGGGGGGKGAQPPPVPNPYMQQQQGGPPPQGVHAPAGGVAAEHAECPISFERLCKGPVGVFLDAQGRRTSPHFYNFNAAQQWFAEHRSCPMTRAPVASVQCVPNIDQDPQGWFRLVDMDGDGKLSRREVVDALKAQMNLDNRALDRFIFDEGAWRSWDTDGSGFITYDELQSIIDFVRQHYFSRRQTGIIPDIRQNKEAWYQYWDEDRNGSLQKDEVARALVKTLGLGDGVRKVQSMRSTLDAIWPIFDPDGSGSVERREFLQPDGLCDTVLASLQPH